MDTHANPFCHNPAIKYLKLWVNLAIKYLELWDKLYDRETAMVENLQFRSSVALFEIFVFFSRLLNMVSQGMLARALDDVCILYPHKIYCAREINIDGFLQ